MNTSSIRSYIFYLSEFILQRSIMIRAIGNKIPNEEGIDQDLFRLTEINMNSISASLDNMIDKESELSSLVSQFPGVKQSNRELTILHLTDRQTLQETFPENNNPVNKILSGLSKSSRIISNELNKCGISIDDKNINSENIHGEQQHYLDLFAQNTIVQYLTEFNDNRGRQDGHYRVSVCGIVSEESEDIIHLDKNGEYVVLIDPLDGSSNIKVGGVMGTIFSIYKRKSKIGSEAVIDDFLQRGLDQAAAGYILYGSSTIFIIATEDGVNGFTRDPIMDSFYLSHPNIMIPSDGSIYSVNEGNYLEFPESVQNFINRCKLNKVSSRYTGSLVSDFHRNLLLGGIYMYPSTSSNPNGKIRLLYESNPLSFIVEQAGGKSITIEQKRILDIHPQDIHEKVPIFIGSKNMIHSLNI